MQTRQRLSDLLLCRSGTRAVPLTEPVTRVVHARGPYTSTTETVDVPAGTRRETFRYAPGEWPPARRLRFALNCGLLSAAALGLFWLAWWLSGNPVPSVATVDLWPSTGETALPFAVSRVWDVPAALAWGFLLSLLVTPPSLRRVLDEDTVGIAVGIGVVGIAGGIAWGIAGGTAVGIAVGIAVGTAVGIAWGTAWGIAVGTAWGIAVGIAGGTAVGLAYCGLAVALPVALVGVPALLLLLWLVARSLPPAAE